MKKLPFFTLKREHTRTKNEKINLYLIFISLLKQKAK